MVLLFYVGINLVFAGGYYLLGPDALQGNIHTSAFLRDFFFSIHSFATIGYGNIVPVGVMANLMVAFEALVGLLGLALATGMVFARFSRPVADIVLLPECDHRALPGHHGLRVPGRQRPRKSTDRAACESRFQPFRKRRWPDSAHLHPAVAGARIRQLLPVELDGGAPD